MTDLDLTDDALHVRLAPWEKVAGLLGDLRVPRSAVTGAQAVDDGLRAARGVRAPGLALPGTRIGTWRGRRGKQYVAVRRGEPGLLLELSGQRYASVLVGTERAAELAAALSRPRP